MEPHATSQQPALPQVPSPCSLRWQHENETEAMAWPISTGLAVVNSAKPRHPISLRPMHPSSSSFNLTHPERHNAQKDDLVPTIPWFSSVRQWTLSATYWSWKFSKKLLLLVKIQILAARSAIPETRIGTVTPIYVDTYKVPNQAARIVTPRVTLAEQNRQDLGDGYRMNPASHGTRMQLGSRAFCNIAL
jgi:hypothetical protein